MYMKNIFEHIEQVKGKPHHIRKRVAFTVAAAGTAIVALVWLVGSLSLGAFAIQGNSFAESTGQESVIATDSNNDSFPANGGIAGAAAALPSANAPARIEIINAASSNSGQKKTERTIIPF